VERLTKNDRASAVAAAAAHILNNDLTVILSSVADSILYLEPGHPARPLLADLQQAAERCAHTAGALLSFGKRAGTKPTPARLEFLMEN
jgi:signal transduction histidine kinase